MLTLSAFCVKIVGAEVTISQSWVEVPLFVSRDLSNRDWRTNRGTSAFTSALRKRGGLPNAQLTKTQVGV